MSHLDPNVVTDILEEIKKHFGYLFISICDTHDLLGMTIKISNDKKVEIIMKHQIEDIVTKLMDICDFKATSPCAKNLWGVNNETELMDDIKADFSIFNSQFTIYYKEDRTRYRTICGIIDHKGCEEKCG